MAEVAVERSALSGFLLNTKDTKITKRDCGPKAFVIFVRFVFPPCCG